MPNSRFGSSLPDDMVLPTTFMLEKGIYSRARTLRRFWPIPPHSTPVYGGKRLPTQEGDTSHLVTLLSGPFCQLHEVEVVLSISSAEGVQTKKKVWLSQVSIKSIEIW